MFHIIETISKIHKKTKKRTEVKRRSAFVNHDAHSKPARNIKCHICNLHCTINTYDVRAYSNIIYDYFLSWNITKISQQSGTAVHNGHSGTHYKKSGIETKKMEELESENGSDDEFL